MKLSMILAVCLSTSVVAMAEDVSKPTTKPLVRSGWVEMPPSPITNPITDPFYFSPWYGGGWNPFHRNTRTYAVLMNSNVLYINEEASPVFYGDSVGKSNFKMKCLYGKDTKSGKGSLRPVGVFNSK